jgi:membrane associated rhomboid family serine protease
VLRFPPLTPFVRTLLIAVSALFVLTAALQNFGGVPVFELLALNPTVLSVATLWQVFTHVLVVPPVPGSVLSLAFSLVFIWLILAPFEERYGRDRALQLSALSAVLAALSAVLVGQLMPSFGTYVAGPQTITLAAICAYAALLPSHAEVSFFGLFPMTPKVLVGIVAALSVVSFLTTRNASQLAADMGAIGAGIGFAKWWMQRAPRRRSFDPRRTPRKGGRLKLVKSEDDEDPKHWLN